MLDATATTTSGALPETSIVPSVSIPISQVTSASQSISSGPAASMPITPMKSLFQQFKTQVQAQFHGAQTYTPSSPLADVSTQNTTFFGGYNAATRQGMPPGLFIPNIGPTS